MNDEINVEIGLRLPNGTHIWPPLEYKGFPIETSEQRHKLAEALTQTEADLNMSPGYFVQLHAWVQREWKNLGEWSIASPDIIGDGDTAEENDES